MAMKWLLDGDLNNKVEGKPIDGCGTNCSLCITGQFKIFTPPANILDMGEKISSFCLQKAFNIHQ